MQTNTFKKQKGFTIIETMISVSIFTLIVVFGINVLLNVNLVSNKSKDMREIMDNLTFIMEEMSRNLRTGYDYHCGSLSNIGEPLSCPLGGYNLAFVEGRTDQQWIYKIGDDLDNNVSIFKSEDGGTTFVKLNSSEIEFDLGTSYFTVFGAEPPTFPFDDQQQPFVVIRLSGTINYKDVPTPFNLQTVVSQRLIDIPA